MGHHNEGSETKTTYRILDDGVVGVVHQHDEHDTRVVLGVLSDTRGSSNVHTSSGEELLQGRDGEVIKW